MEDEKVGVLEERVSNLESRFERNETKVERITDDVVILKQQATETKIYVTQIFSQMEDIKQSIRHLGQREAGTRERSSNYWLEFFKAIAYIVLSAVVTYFTTHIGK